MGGWIFNDRDLSWLSFNSRILSEAADESVPLLERIRFLSIYSSNLDEFYRVRVPVLMAMNKVQRGQGSIYAQVKAEINRQQAHYGQILTQAILPALEKEQVYWMYHAALPEFLNLPLADLFFNNILAYLQPQVIDGETPFFAVNNALYQAVVLRGANQEERIEMVNLPTDALPRFFKLEHQQRRYVVFLDDIIKLHLKYLYPRDTIMGVYQVKVTRDAGLQLEEEVETDMMLLIEQELSHRDEGYATRFLSEPGIPLRHLFKMIYALHLEGATVVSGGVYHHLKDLSQFPLEEAKYRYPPRKKIAALEVRPGETLLGMLQKREVLLHPPYQDYALVLRFFNEAAHDKEVEAIYCTLYRVAEQSKIVLALITAAKNGKEVTVILELKARFDEANNIKWAKEMKKAGVRIHYSSVSFKVHAKVALIKRKAGHVQRFQGLLATGNFNETTASFYTDHVLMSNHQPMLQELEALFTFLAKKKKRPEQEDFIPFKELLVSQFNLQDEFVRLIDQEIAAAKAGKPAGIRIKLNNLEEPMLISKLYEASQAGVRVALLVRSICTLVAGVAGQSENITVKRILGRYLEHGRLFVFHNQGDERVFMGSADWMNRNIHHRIEVCFPVHEPALKKELLALLEMQYAAGEEHSQERIYHYLLKAYQEEIYD